MTTKKLPWKLYIIYGILAGWFGYFIAGAYQPGQDIFFWYNEVIQNWNAPFENYWNQYSVYGILTAVGIYGFVLFLSVVGRKNFMFGKEYGSSRFASPAFINKELADHNDSREGNIVVKNKREIIKR